MRPVGRTAIPWATVLTFATVLTVANWFWVVALRGAVGATERTRGPFLSWLEGSVLLIPLFAFAVLGALALAHRWFGGVLRSRRAVLATSLLVVAAGTLAGVGALLASGSYDLRLQLSQHMVPMGVSCHPESCHQLQQNATVALQLKALGIGSLILLATNLVLVFWVLAMRGGRLNPGKVQAAGAGPAVRRQTWSGEVQLVLVAALVGTGTVLAVHATADILKSVVAAGALLMVATAQLVVAQQAMSRPGWRAWIAAAGVAIALPVVWVWAHLTGNQLGGVLKSIGLADGAVGVLDLVTLATAVLLLSSPAWLRRAPASPHAGKLGLVALVAVAAIGVGGSGLAMFDLGGLDENPTPGNHHVAVG